MDTEEVFSYEIIGEDRNFAHNKYILKFSDENKILNAKLIYDKTKQETFDMQEYTSEVSIIYDNGILFIQVEYTSIEHIYDDYSYTIQYFLVNKDLTIIKCIYSHYEDRLYHVEFGEKYVHVISDEYYDLYERKTLNNVRENFGWGFQALTLETIAYYTNDFEITGFNDVEIFGDLAVINDEFFIDPVKEYMVYHPKGPLLIDSMAMDSNNYVSILPNDIKRLISDYTIFIYDITFSESMYDLSTDMTSLWDKLNQEHEDLNLYRVICDFQIDELPEKEIPIDIIRQSTVDDMDRYFLGNKYYLCDRYYLQDILRTESLSHDVRSLIEQYLYLHENSLYHINPWYAERKITNLMVIAARGYWQLLYERDKFNLQLNQQDIEGRTALHYALTRKPYAVEMVKILIRNGARLDIPDIYNITPQQMIDSITNQKIRQEYRETTPLISYQT